MLRRLRHRRTRSRARALAQVLAALDDAVAADAGHRPAGRVAAGRHPAGPERRRTATLGGFRHAA
jgi:hypothetical protein